MNKFIRIITLSTILTLGSMGAQSQLVYSGVKRTTPSRQVQNINTQKNASDSLRHQADSLAARASELSEMASRLSEMSADLSKVSSNLAETQANKKNQGMHGAEGGQAPYLLPDSIARFADYASVPFVTPEMVDSIRNSKTIETFEHNIESTTFVDKGTWIAGLSFNYTQGNSNKYQFLIIENLNGDSYSFKVSPMVAYAVRDDLAFGVKFSYVRNLIKLANADLVLDAETNTNLDHIYSLSHNYYGIAFMRNYFSLGNSKRFGFFNELQFELGGGQSKITQGRGIDLTGSYERNIHFKIGLAPGLMVFLNNYSAMEVNIGVLGFNYTHTKTIKDQIYKSSRKSKSANFRINLFSITFGTTFYI